MYVQNHLGLLASPACLQAKLAEQQQQKELLRRNAELAKARLESGDYERARREQAEMQRLYGTTDWRADKKLRTEKRKLERTVAAGKKLATFEAKEAAKMDAFRVALGLPTAEAQRQAEWRAEATRALAEAAMLAEGQSPGGSVKKGGSKRIGPRLPS
eukprot:SM000339S12950  [mRNA]  locus=s339:11403:13424:+ [translate_table: standard]